MSITGIILNERADCKVAAVMEDKPNLATK
jgi:hypothetical protein